MEVAESHRKVTLLITNWVSKILALSTARNFGQGVWYSLRCAQLFVKCPYFKNVGIIQRICSTCFKCVASDQLTHWLADSLIKFIEIRKHWTILYSPSSILALPTLLTPLSSKTKTPSSPPPPPLSFCSAPQRRRSPPLIVVVRLPFFVGGYDQVKYWTFFPLSLKNYRVFVHKGQPGQPIFDSLSLTTAK